MDYLTEKSALPGHLHELVQNYSRKHGWKVRELFPSTPSQDLHSELLLKWRDVLLANPKLALQALHGRANREFVAFITDIDTDSILAAAHASISESQRNRTRHAAKHKPRSVQVAETYCKRARKAKQVVDKWLQDGGSCDDLADVQAEDKLSKTFMTAAGRWLTELAGRDTAKEVGKPVFAPMNEPQVVAEMEDNDAYVDLVQAVCDEMREWSGVDADICEWLLRREGGLSLLEHPPTGRIPPAGDRNDTHIIATIRSVPKWRKHADGFPDRLRETISDVLAMRQESGRHGE